MDGNEIILSAKGCSGRGIRFRELSATEIDSVQNDAVKLLGPEATVNAVRQLEQRECVMRMLLAVTKKGGLDADSIRTAEWEPLTLQKLAMPNSELFYDKLFRAKEQVLLGGIFVRYHKVTNDEVDAIVEKALPVSVA